MTVYDVLIDFTIASVLILVGQLLRSKIKFFQEFFMPASMIAGFLGLFLGKQFAGILPFSSGAGSYSGVLIILIFTVVGVNGFSSGKKGAGGETVKRVLGFTLLKNIAFFSQFAVGIALTLTVIKAMVPDINPGFGVLMASGFTGGHGTAAAVGNTFEELGWAEAKDLGMTFATVGILSGIFGGLALIKTATKKGWTAYIKDFKFISGELRTGLIQKENRKALGGESTSSVSLDGLAFQLAVVVTIAGFGYMLNKFVLAPHVIKGIPDFTVAFLLALAFFMAAKKTPIYNYIDKSVTSHISGTATDYLVFFGVSQINVGVIIEYALPLLIGIIGGWFCVLIVLFPFGHLMSDKSWFERAIFIFGYSTGVYAIGFVLLRIVDPDNLSHTVEDTAMSPWLSFVEIFCWSLVPTMLLAGQGWTVVIVCVAAMVATVIAAFILKTWWTAPLAGRGGYQGSED